MAKKDKAAKGKEAQGSSSKDAPTKEKKSRKQERVKGRKGRGWDNSSEDNLQEELAAVGLRVKDVTGDGNCFFRACSDQLEGTDSLHSSLRQQVVQHIRDNEDQFRPFVEDDETFEVYCKRMGKDGIWAGQMELVAASQVLRCSFTIYQSGQPRWTIQFEPPVVEDSKPVAVKAASTAKHPLPKAAAAPPPRMLHLSYHDGMHYNSVRMLDDFGSGPPEPVVLCLQKSSDREHDGKSSLTAQSQQEKQVSRSTGCWDPEVIRKALEDADDDIDEAIETVVEWMSNNTEATTDDTTPIPFVITPVQNIASSNSIDTESSPSTGRESSRKASAAGRGEDSSAQAVAGSNSQRSGSQSDADAEAGSGNVSGSDSSDPQLQQPQEDQQAECCRGSFSDTQGMDCALRDPPCCVADTPVGIDSKILPAQKGQHPVLAADMQTEAECKRSCRDVNASMPPSPSQQQHTFLWEASETAIGEHDGATDVGTTEAFSCEGTDSAGRNTVDNRSAHAHGEAFGSSLYNSAALKSSCDSFACAEPAIIHPAASSLNHQSVPIRAVSSITVQEDSTLTSSAPDQTDSAACIVSSQPVNTASAVPCLAHVEPSILEPKDSCSAWVANDASSAAAVRKGSARKVHVASTVKVKPPAGNKACPCGSKKKYKSCCGPAAAAAARRSKAGGGDGELKHSDCCGGGASGLTEGNGKKVVGSVNSAATQMGNLML